MTPETLAAIKAIFNETFIGIGNENGTYYNDSSAESGLCGVLDKVTAEIASRAPRPGGKTIVGHVRHVRIHADHVARHLRAEPSKVDWAASFDPPAATPAEWDEIRVGLRNSVARLLETVEASKHADTIATAFGAIAHGAYHLGAIKQILLAVRGG